MRVRLEIEILIKVACDIARNCYGKCFTTHETWNMFRAICKRSVSFDEIARYPSARRLISLNGAFGVVRPCYSAGSKLF